MKTNQLIGLLLFSSLGISACSDNKPEAMDAKNLQVTEEMKKISGAEYFVGSLMETFNAGGYTYAKILTTKGNVWAAGPTTTLANGDKISFSSKMLMNNFYSKAKKRDFKEIYFVKGFTVNGMNMALKPKMTMPETTMPATIMAKTGMSKSNMPMDAGKMNPHANKGMPHAKAKLNLPPLKPMKKAAKGQDINEIIVNAKSFKGKQVVVRGQVTKVTTNILGANWIHIRDSSTNDDLTITTSGTTKTGDIVLVKGTLSLDKDFGKGFVIGRVIADANVKVE